MTAPVKDLLPANAAPFERALAEALSDDLPVPLREIFDPAVSPEAFLPFLASHKSVDLWFEDWPTERKREMIGEAPVLARLKGTRDGTRRFLYYVDGELLDVIAYPARFVFGRAKIGRTPINHPAFAARHLIKVETYTPPRAFVFGRAKLGRHVIKTPSRDPFKRVFIALRAAKAPSSEYRVDFAHQRQITIDDGLSLDDGYALGDFVDRVKL